MLATRSACLPSLASCLSLHGESLPSVPNAYHQFLEALLSQPAASEKRIVLIVHTHDHGLGMMKILMGFHMTQSLSSEHMALSEHLSLLLHNPYCLLESHPIPHNSASSMTLVIDSPIGHSIYGADKSIIYPSTSDRSGSRTLPDLVYLEASSGTNTTSAIGGCSDPRV
ncbi:hypothetical protein Tco_0412717 [Tanacetum coccineum]